MKSKWKRIFASAAITAAVMTSGLQGFAAEPSAPTDAVRSTLAQVNLTDMLGVEITSVLNEKESKGTRIGVVVRMKNNGESIARVPEYEVSVKTSEGVKYALQSSATNAKSIQPKANTDLRRVGYAPRRNLTLCNQLLIENRNS